MKVTLTARNQITIPKEIIEKLNLQKGQVFDLIVDNGCLKLLYDAKNIKVNIAQTSSKSSRKIISNLKEAENYSRKVVSECGLLVRTKKSYLDNVCAECKGMLAKEYGEDKYPCRYNKSHNELTVSSNSEKFNSNSSSEIKEVKPVIAQLTDNVHKLQSTIDENIASIQKEFP